MRVCFATNNTHKLREAQEILGTGFQLLTLHDIGCHDELPEDNDTIEANSAQKAEFVFRTYHIPCFADDSGLFVTALHGLPGADSAHYAGPQRSATHNVRRLLAELDGQSDRSAYFKTVITFAETKTMRQFEGVVEGQIIRQPRGAGGFGYDPVFIPAGHSETFGEMDAAEKNAISHRGRAMRALAEFLKTNPFLK